MHFHWYTDDTQLYLLKPDNTLQLVKLKENLMHIKFQMTSNFLLLNSEKKMSLLSLLHSNRLSLLGVSQ